LRSPGLRVECRGSGVRGQYARCSRLPPSAHSSASALCDEPFRPEAHPPASRLSPFRARARGLGVPCSAGRQCPRGRGVRLPLSSPTYVCVMRRIRPSMRGYTRRPNGQRTDASAVRFHTAPGLLAVTSGNNLCMKKETPAYAFTIMKLPVRRSAACWRPLRRACRAR
jgi:hypothetical protein